MADETEAPRIIHQDPRYEWVPPMKSPLANGAPRGRQCGQCGMKFEYGTTYGYCCTWINCPMGWNS